MTLSNDDIENILTLINQQSGSNAIAGKEDMEWRYGPFDWEGTCGRDQWNKVRTELSVKLREMQVPLHLV